MDRYHFIGEGSRSGLDGFCLVPEFRVGAASGKNPHWKVFGATKWRNAVTYFLSGSSWHPTDPEILDLVFETRGEKILTLRRYSEDRYIVFGETCVMNVNFWTAVNGPGPRLSLEDPRAVEDGLSNFCEVPEIPTLFMYSGAMGKISSFKTRRFGRLVLHKINNKLLIASEHFPLSI